MATEKNALYAALAAAQQRARKVEKDSKNTFHKYAYASTESIIEAAKEALADSGLAIIPRAWKIVPPMSEGGKATLERTFALVHGSGETTDILTAWPIVPDKGRPDDKALASALTSGLGYMLRDLLLMPRVDETDEMDHGSRQYEQPRWQSPQSPHTPPTHEPVDCTEPPEAEQPPPGKGAFVTPKLMTQLATAAKALGYASVSEFAGRPITSKTLLHEEAENLIARLTNEANRRSKAEQAQAEAPAA